LKQLQNITIREIILKGRQVKKEEEYYTS